MQKIDIKEFFKLNKEKRYDLLYNKIINLNKKICELKGIKSESDDFFHISEEIYYNSIWFEDLRFLCSEFDKTKYKKIKDIKDDEYKYMINIYNDLIDEVNKYQKIDKLIKEKGYSNLEKEYKENLENLFYKMLDFKKRKYEKGSTLLKLLDEINLCYYDYECFWTPLYQLLNGKCIYKDTDRDDFWLIKADDVEYIGIMKEIYEIFASGKEDYKNYDQLYEDITLQENQTIEDLYDSELKKLEDLYVEMLKFKNIEVKQNEHKNLAYEVEKNFPQFEDAFNFLYYVKVNPHSSYIDLIDTVRKIYKNLKENYKK